MRGKRGYGEKKIKKIKKKYKRRGVQFLADISLFPRFPPPTCGGGESGIGIRI